MSTQSKELVVTNDNYNLTIIEGEMLQAFQEELDGLGQIPLDYVKMPSGGGIVFEIPGDDPENPDVVKELKGIIIHHHPFNSYWISDQITNEAPDCQSNDGKTGIDRETGEVRNCATCPHNQFREDGTGKDCKNSHRIYLLQEGSPLPVILNLPPTSLKMFRDYIGKRLLLKGKRPAQVVTTINLKKEQTKDGTPYATTQFKKFGDLAPADIDKAKAMTEYIKEMAQTMPAIDDATIEAEAVPTTAPKAQNKAKKKANPDVEYDDAPFPEEPQARGPFPETINEAAAAAAGIPAEDEFEEIG